MTSEDKNQFKVRIPRSIQDGFRRTVSKKYGIDKYGLLSYEVMQMMIHYISLGGILPTYAHTHKKQSKQQRLERTISTPENPRIGMTTAIVAGGSGSRGSCEQYHNRPPQDDPVLKYWLLSKGIDLANPDCIISHITEEDIKIGEMPDPELLQWKSGIHNRLIAIRRQRDNKKWRIQEVQLGKELEPELRQIKSYLVNNDSIKDGNYVHEDDFYKAWTVITSKSDRQRTFKNYLKKYETAGYLSSFSTKKKIYRLKDTLISL